VTAELARRLFRTSLDQREVEEALLVSLRTNVAFVRALVEIAPLSFPIVERELARFEGLSIRTVRAVPELMARLPVGLCERLLAVPVRRDRFTATVDVACVDPFDAHVPVELAYHLKSPVRVLRAPLRQVLSALDTPRSSPYTLMESEDRTPAFGTPVVRPPATGLRYRVPGQAQVGVGGSYPSWGVPPAPDPAVPGLGSTDIGGDRVIDALRDATSPGEVAFEVVEGASEVAGRVLLFVVRSGGYQGRAGDPGLDPDRVRQLTLPATQPSVLETASQAGFYHGPLPPTPVHRGMARELQLASEEAVYVLPIGIEGRPALVLVTAQLPNTTEPAIRRLDTLVQVASEALARILKERSRSRQ